MMTPDQAKVVGEVFRRFLEGEEGAGWDEVDTQLQHLESLTDDETYKEADIQVYYHNYGKVKCSQEFCNQGCYAQTVVDAVIYICDLYKETGNLHKNNRYILSYYLALSHLKMIVSDATK